MKKPMVISACVVFLLALLLAVGLLYPVISWSGATVVQFRIKVYDQYSGKPISGAKVQFFIPDLVKQSQLSPQELDELLLRQRQSGTTDQNGSLTLFALCGAGGTRGLFGRSGHFTVFHEMTIEAPAYRKVQIPLATAIGGKRWSIRQKQFVLNISLIKDTNSE